MFNYDLSTSWSSLSSFAVANVVAGATITAAIIAATNSIIYITAVTITIIKQHVGLNKASWRLLASYVTRWAHRLPVVSSWHACLASASTLLLRQLKAQHGHLAKEQAREHVLAQKKWRRGDRQGERKGDGGDEGAAAMKLLSSHRSTKKDEQEATAAVLLFWPLNSARKAGNRSSFVNGSSSSAPGGNAKKVSRSTGGSSGRRKGNDDDNNDDDDEDFLLNGYYEDEASEGEDESVLAEVGGRLLAKAQNIPLTVILVVVASVYCLLSHQKLLSLLTFLEFPFGKLNLSGTGRVSAHGVPFAFGGALFVGACRAFSGQSQPSGVPF